MYLYHLFDMVSGVVWPIVLSPRRYEVVDCVNDQTGLDVVLRARMEAPLKPVMQRSYDPPIPPEQWYSKRK